VVHCSETRKHVGFFQVTSFLSERSENVNLLRVHTELVGPGWDGPLSAAPGEGGSRGGLIPVRDAFVPDQPKSIAATVRTDLDGNWVAISSSSMERPWSRHGEPWDGRPLDPAQLAEPLLLRRETEPMQLDLF